MDTKKCSKCGEVKVVEEFRHDNRNVSGFKSQCRQCEREYAKEYREKHPEKFKESKLKYRSSKKGKQKEKEWVKNNPEKVKEKTEKYLSNPENKKKHLEAKKIYRDSHKKEISDYNRQYKNENRDKINKQRTKYRNDNKDVYYKKKHYRSKIRRENDDMFALYYKIRRNIYKAFKRSGYTKKSVTYDILGCDYKFFKEYIESKFVEGMAWDNYGVRGWHLDHIIPISSAKTEDDVYKLCHYTNYQPLWAKDNIEKSNKTTNNIQLKFI